MNVLILHSFSTMIRNNTNLLGEVDSNLRDEEVRKHLLELDEEVHDEKREALAVFNNKVEPCATLHVFRHD